MRRSTKAGIAGVAALLAAAVALVAFSCTASNQSGKDDDPWKGLGGPPRVVATFPPLACFVQNVGGDHVAVLTLCTNTGPHEFDPGNDDTRKLKQADLFFINGLGLDDRFAANMALSSDNPRLRESNGKKVGVNNAPGFINLGDYLIKADKGLVEENEDEEERKEHGRYDPHVWLGIPQAKKMVETIRDELTQFDKPHADDYDRRAKEYIARLEKLHQDGVNALKDKKNRKIVTSHDSLRYFAKSFNLEVAYVIEVQPGAEPDQQRIGELVKACKEENVRVFATEPQYHLGKMIDTIRSELARKGVTDIKVIDLDPMETTGDDKQLDAGWYERRMRANLDALKDALP